MAPRATWCPTLGECDAIAVATPTHPAGRCAGLVCAHGCQRRHQHASVQGLTEVPAAAPRPPGPAGPALPPPGADYFHFAEHAAPPLGSAAREATAPPYIGQHRALPHPELRDDAQV